MEAYLNLRGEMVKRNLKNGDLARLLNVHNTTIGNKFNNRGNSDFSVSEAILIKETYFPDISVEVLFKKRMAP